MTAPLYTDEMAERLKARAGEKYRPSNGSEGMMFMERWCAKCQRDAAYRAGTGDSCPIVCNSLIHSIDEEGYPAEWQYGDDGQPRCSAFELAKDIAQ